MQNHQSAHSTCELTFPTSLQDVLCVRQMHAVFAVFSGILCTVQMVFLRYR